MKTEDGLEGGLGVLVGDNRAWWGWAGRWMGLPKGCSLWDRSPEAGQCQAWVIWWLGVLVLLSFCSAIFSILMRQDGGNVGTSSNSVQRLGERGLPSLCPTPLLAAPCGLWELISPSGDCAQALGSKNVEFSPLDRQGVPSLCSFLRARQTFPDDPLQPSTPTKTFPGISLAGTATHPMLIPKPITGKGMGHISPTAHKLTPLRVIPWTYQEVHRASDHAVPLELECPSWFFHLEKSYSKATSKNPLWPAGWVGGLLWVPTAFQDPTQCDLFLWPQCRVGPVLVQLYTPSAQPRGGAWGLMGSAWGRLKLSPHLHHLHHSPANRRAQAGLAVARNWGLFSAPRGATISTASQQGWGLLAWWAWGGLVHCSCPQPCQGWTSPLGTASV